MFEGFGQWINGHTAWVIAAEFIVPIVLGLLWTWRGHKRLPVSKKLYMSGCILTIGFMLGLLISPIIYRESFPHEMLIVIFYFLAGGSIVAVFITAKRQEKREYREYEEEAIRNYGSVENALDAAAQLFYEQVANKLENNSMTTMSDFTDLP